MPMGDHGEIRQRRRAEIKKMLPLQTAAARFPETAATRCARCSGRVEASPGWNCRVIGAETACDDRHTLAIQAAWYLDLRRPGSRLTAN
jgi:hypothetical protein